MSDEIIKIIVCSIAGLGAGVGTGFSGMSAAAVISPMLITLLNMSHYDAVGIALASDVLASAVSAILYGKNKNIDINNGIIMMISVLIFTFVGSWVGQFVHDVAMSGFSLVFIIILGIKFFVKPIKKDSAIIEEGLKMSFALRSLVCGAIVGFICGFIGAGGGMMMLFVLTSLLGYELKTAVGTSVFIMTFSALTGSISHFGIAGDPDWICLVTCVISTFIFAVLSARVANKSKPETLNKVVGVVLIIIGVVLISIEGLRYFNFI